MRHKVSYMDGRSNGSMDRFNHVIMEGAGAPAISFGSEIRKLGSPNHVSQAFKVAKINIKDGTFSVHQRDGGYSKLYSQIPGKGIDKHPYMMRILMWLAFHPEVKAHPKAPQSLRRSARIAALPRPNYRF